jgi:hypothetical protein
LNTTGSGAPLVSSREYSGQDVLCDHDSLYSGNRFCARKVSLKTAIKTNRSLLFFAKTRYKDNTLDETFYKRWLPESLLFGPWEKITSFSFTFVLAPKEFAH